MPIQYASGLPYPRVTDPTSLNVENDRGLYLWSVISAYLSTLVEGDVVSTAGLEGELVNILVFCQDLPATATLLGTDNTSLLQYQSDVENRLSVPFLVTASGGATPVAATNYGQVLTGYAGAASAVKVSGFPTRVSVVAPGTEGVVDTAKLTCITNGVSITAPIGGPTGNDLAPTPIVLLNTQYTAAILAADNIITDASDNLYIVVGLYLPVP